MLTSSIYLLPVLVMAASGLSRDDPTDILQVKHLLIKDYTGPLRFGTLQLFGNIESLELRNCNFTPYHESFLHPLHKLKRLAISNNVMERVNDDTRGCCSNLEEIELSDSGVGDLADVELHKIAAMKSLKRIYFHHEKIPIIHHDSLPEDSNLVDVTIEYCTLHTIEVGALDKLTKLERLNLKNNKLEDINKEVLAPLEKLKELDLSGNLLESITTDQFPLLPNLEVLIVGYNPIKEFNLDGIREVAPKLRTVDVSGITADTSKSGGVELVTVNDS